MVKKLPILKIVCTVLVIVFFVATPNSWSESTQDDENTQGNYNTTTTIQNTYEQNSSSGGYCNFLMVNDSDKEKIIGRGTVANYVPPEEQR